MRCVSYEKMGPPAEVLTVVDVPMPEPGPGQARVALRASPIHNHDLMTVRGMYGTKPTLPSRAGSEALGVVDAVASDVTALKVGQRVVVSGIRGAWSERFVADARSLVPLPDAIDDDTGCQLLAMPLSTMLVLKDLDVKAGDWIVQNAASGAVGTMLAGFAAKQGVNVISLVRREDAVAAMTAKGIANVVSTEHADWQARAKALTGGAPITRAIDSVGGRGANDLAALLANDATLISFGAMSREPLQFDADNLLFKQTTVKGFWATRRSATAAKGEIAGLIGELVKRAASGELVLPVDEKFELARVREAMTACDRPGRTGKIVLVSST